jgi:hypothetical protein
MVGIFLGRDLQFALVVRGIGSGVMDLLPFFLTASMHRSSCDAIGVRNAGV